MEMGGGGAVFIALAGEDKAENHLICKRLHKAGTHLQDIQRDYIA